MTATVHNAVADLQRANAELRHQLDECRAECDEALEQQAAIAEVLQVINSSPGDLAPVFDAILEKAHLLCGAEHGSLGIYEGDYFRGVAARGYPEPFVERLRHGFDGLDNPVTRPLFEGARFVQIPDLGEIDHPIPKAAAALGGFRTALFVPLRKDGRLLGHISASRYEIRPFGQKDIALLENFAAQAVIAMENARLLGELRERTSDLEESLEYQTATSDVLKVISRSTFDLQPVLDALLQTASRLCGNAEGALAIRQGDVLRYVATVALTPEFDAALRQRVLVPDRGSTAGRAALEGAVVQIPDIAIDPEYALPEVQTLGKLRTTLGVPLLREGETIGVITLAHRRVEPFTERQVALVSTFADQAVIAIENTRLITETREALEQQTATAEILRVISSSPTDVQPTFDAIAEGASKVCGATSGVFRFDGSLIHFAAHCGWSPGELDSVRGVFPLPPGRGSLTARAILNRDVVHVADIATDPDYAHPSIPQSGQHTVLSVPMLRDGNPIGAITASRRQIEPFSEAQIELLKTFADQAVIAIENVRLFNELRARQAELRVTFDNMGDGVAMFDSELRLAAWNMNFQKILDLPAAFLAARPTLSEYVDYLAARGEYGSSELEAELRRGVAIAGHETRFERTRPDGRVIEVRRNAVPGGGSVLIFSDVTERKRAEEAVRMARDSAEAALRDLKTAQASLVQAEKMASLGQLTAGIAHEIKNPLNFVNNFASLSVELLDELKENAAPALAMLDADKRADLDDTMAMLTGNLEKIGEHGKRADGIVRSMLEHSRGATGERRNVDLNNLVDEALNLAYHGARAQDQSFNITLERDYASALKPIELAPQEITRVFLNLFGNGFYAANKRSRENGDGSFRPTLAVATHDDGDAVQVKVRDNGIGIAPEFRDMLFQPFFTTKPTGEGTGLGLSISYDIITQQHGGTITVESEPGAFTEFIVRLPRP